MKNNNNSHFVPEVVKNIAWKLSPQNKIVNSNERWIAEQQIEAIMEYCKSALGQYRK